MEDNVLIEQFLSGDEQGFTMLVKKYQDQVANIVHSLTQPARNVDDIVQEVFIKVYNGLRAFRKEAEFSTWLYRITLNTTYNYIKKEERYVPVDAVEETVASSKHTWGDLESREKQELVSQALKSLPFQFRSAIVLKEIEGLTYKEIAKALNCRIGTVESRLFRARKMLKEILTPIINQEATNAVS